MSKTVYKLGEKRQLQRFSVALPSMIEPTGGNLPVMSLFSRDVCAGGAFYLTDSPLPVGTPVMIKMIMKLKETGRSDVTNSQISVSGTVVRADASGMAVCFAKRYKIASLGSAKLKVN